MSIITPTDQSQAAAAPTLRERIVALWGAGLTSEQITAEVGVTRNVVMGHISRAGLFGTNANAQPVVRPVVAAQPVVEVFPAAGHCLWAEGVVTAAYVFCGLPVAGATPYCAAHRARAYIRPVEKVV